MEIHELTLTYNLGS